jgi:hypothetical protein
MLACVIIRKGWLGMLSVIVAVTMTAPDLGAVEEAYTRHLSYQVIERGYVSADLARGWNAPAVEGRRYLVMQPASGAPVYLRVVQQPATPGYAPLTTYGWNSNEILVEDPDALAAKLAMSPFTIIGEPRPLSMNPKVRAMQVVGPAEEVLYLTRIPPGGSLFDLGSAKSFVDRTFIVVLGGPDMAAMLKFYRDVLGLPVTDANPAAVSVVNAANQLAPETIIPLAIARLPKNFLVEIDQYPSVAKTRPTRAGELPPAMAIVSFAAPDLSARALPWLVPPSKQLGKPYDGRRAGLLRGAAGELVEIIEQP